MTARQTAGPAAAGGEPGAPAADVFSSKCPSRRVMQEITGKWGALTLGALYGGTMRFTELHRRVDGISERMLAQTLRTLERDGLVHREEMHGGRTRVEYSLTGLGREITAVLSTLIDTLEGGFPRILEAQRGYDAAAGE